MNTKCFAEDLLLMLRNDACASVRDLNRLLVLIQALGISLLAAGLFLNYQVTSESLRMQHYRDTQELLRDWPAATSAAMGNIYERLPDIDNCGKAATRTRDPARITSSVGLDCDL